LNLIKLKKKDFLKSLTDSLATSGINGKLQARDYEIMRFILEQKFCSLEAIYFRFFDVRKFSDEKLPKQLWTTRQRLAKLRGYFLLKTEKVLSSGRAHYLLTPLGYKILVAKLSEALVIKPTSKIDFSLYDHDMRLTMIRAHTEARGKSKKWYSEKYLKAQAIELGDNHKKFQFSKDLRPDAVFLNSKNERIALELEVARKNRARIEEKIRLYDELLEERERSGEKIKVLDKVWFILTKPVVARYLIKMMSYCLLARRQDCF